MSLLGNNSLDILKDPFKKDNIERVRLTMYKGCLSGKMRFDGSVEFRNGNTLGEQEFEAKDWQDLANQVERFIESL